MGSPKPLRQTGVLVNPGEKGGSNGCEADVSSRLSGCRTATSARDSEGGTSGAIAEAAAVLARRSHGGHSEVAQRSLIGRSRSGADAPLPAALSEVPAVETASSLCVFTSVSGDSYPPGSRANAARPTRAQGLSDSSALVPGRAGHLQAQAAAPAPAPQNVLSGDRASEEETRVK